MTDPTPRAREERVREALVGVFTHFPYSPELMVAAGRLIHALGLPIRAEAEHIADALLALRAAPAEAEGEVTEAMVLEAVTWASDAATMTWGAKKMAEYLTAALRGARSGEG